MLSLFRDALLKLSKTTSRKKLVPIWLHHTVRWYGTGEKIVKSSNIFVFQIDNTNNNVDPKNLNAYPDDISEIVQPI